MGPVPQPTPSSLISRMARRTCSSSASSTFGIEGKLTVAEAMIVVWDGESRGSAHMINVAKKSGKPIFVFHVEKEKK